MKEEDIRNALVFLEKDKTINLVVLKKQDIPYVKRYIIQHLGQPNKIIGGILDYGDITIDVYSVYYNIQNLLGLRGKTFYVRYKSEEDIKTLKDFIPVIELPAEPVSMWKSLGYDYHTMYRALMADGYSPEEAVNILAYMNVEVL